MDTKEQVGAAIAVLHALAEAIRIKREVPSGHLYAMVTGKVTLEAYEGAVACLVRAGLVEKRGHLLRWVGPEIDAVSASETVEDNPPDVPADACPAEDAKEAHGEYLSELKDAQS